MNEKEIIQRLKKRDESAIEEIMAHYTPYVSTIIYNVSKGSISAADIEEAAADTFFALWNNAEKIREGYLTGYLSAISYAAFKKLLILFKRSIEIKVLAFSFAVPHFAENSSVGACDTFDSANGAVCVEEGII